MTTPALVPLFRTAMALQSLRDSGYSLSAALGEAIDNSLEANANTVDVVLHEAATGRGKKQHIQRIVIADDGDGMELPVLHHYLMIGFSTRYMSRKTIGKYGVGAKLAAFNFGRRIDVWSRRSDADPWQHVYIDLDDAIEAEQRGETIGIAPPTPSEIPLDLAAHFPKGKGTVVAWSKIDRLEDGRHAPSVAELRAEVEREVSRIFRKFIGDGIAIRVNGTALLPHDPLFRMSGTWADKVLNDELTPAEPTHYAADVITESEAIEIFGHKAYLTVTVYPREVLRNRGKGGDALAKKLRVQENKGALSFLRLNREIAYTTVPRIFPSAVTDPDRFIGIEVAFAPELDEYFGVRNVKRGVEPHGELRNQIQKRLERYLKTARGKIDEAWQSAASDKQAEEGEQGPIAEAVKDANNTLPKARATPVPENKRREALEELAEDAGKSTPDAKQSYLDRIRDLPFVIEPVSFPGNQFVVTQHLGHQVLIRVNTRHRFYKELWKPIREIAQQDATNVSPEEAARLARRTLEALSLLVIAYAKAESMHETPHQQYDDLRNYWGQFLETLLGKVKDVF